MRELIRKGECKKCGLCCVGCHNYDEKNNTCLVYETRGRGCRTYPQHPYVVFHEECAFQFYDAETGELLPRGKKHPELMDVYEPVDEECR